MDDQNIFDIDPTIFDDFATFDSTDLAFQNQDIRPDPERIRRIREFRVPHQPQLGRRTLPLGFVASASEQLAFARSFFDGARQGTLRAFSDPTRRAPRFRYWPDSEGYLVPLQFGVVTTYVDEVQIEEFFPTLAPATEDGVFDEVRDLDPLHPEGLIPRSVPSEPVARTAQSDDSIRLRELILIATLQVREEGSFANVQEAWDQVVSRVEGTRILIREDIETVWNLQFGGRVNFADLLFVREDIVHQFVLSNLRFAEFPL